MTSENSSNRKTVRINGVPILHFRVSIYVVSNKTVDVMSVKLLLKCDISTRNFN